MIGSSVQLDAVVNGMGGLALPIRGKTKTIPAGLENIHALRVYPIQVPKHYAVLCTATFLSFASPLPPSQAPLLSCRLPLLFSRFLLFSTLPFFPFGRPSPCYFLACVPYLSWYVCASTVVLKCIKSKRVLLLPSHTKQAFFTMSGV